MTNPSDFNEPGIDKMNHLDIVSCVSNIGMILVAPHYSTTLIIRGNWDRYNLGYREYCE